MSYDSSGISDSPGSAVSAESTQGAAPGRPVPGTPRSYRFPRFETHTLSNKLRVTVAPLHDFPVITTLALVQAGATRDPLGLEGLATLTTGALVEGTATLDSLGLAMRMEMLGTTLDTGADWDSAIAQLTALTSNVGDAMSVLADVLRSPVFPEVELERLRAERLAGLAQMRTEPRALAQVFFARQLYSPESRFARLAGGDEESVALLSRERVLEFHDRWYRPASTSLMITGDVSVDDAMRMAEASFGSWSADEVPATDTLAIQRYTEPRVHLVHKADAPQSELRVGHVAVPRVSEDYFPLVVMNAILGGLFSSRLNLNLREEHAYTYGAHSAFAWRRAASPFEISTAVETAVTADALREIIREFHRIRDESVTEAELSLAISYLVGVFPLRFESTAAVAGGLASMEIFRLPVDYFDSYRDRITAVTADDVQRVARRHLDPSRLQVVIVGDAEVIRDPVSALGLGALDVHEPYAGGHRSS